MLFAKDVTGPAASDPKRTDTISGSGHSRLERGVRQRFAL